MRWWILRTGSKSAKINEMTIQQKQALKEARSPKHTRTSAEAYAQMALVMRMTPKTIGTGVRGNVVSSTTGEPARG